MADNLFCCRCGQKLVKKQYEGRVRDYCPQCRAAQYRNPVPASAAIVVDASDRVLLVKRGMPPKAGEWCLPGGYIELDEQAHDSCRRELHEETGLTGHSPELIGVYLSDNPFYHSVLVSAFHIQVDDLTALHPGDDSTDCRFFSAGEIPPLAFHSHQQALADYRARHGKGVRVSGAPWGAYLITSRDPLVQVQAALKGGVRIVQYRDKIGQNGHMYRTAMELRRITAAAGVKLIINDQADLAMAVGADGVHIGQEDMPIEALRAILPSGMLIGLSTHSREQALDAVARGADYIGCGPLFATPTKADYQPVGLELLAWVLGHVDLPVVAIGGIDMTNISQLAALGARNVAMVRAFTEDTARRVAAVNELLL